MCLVNTNSSPDLVTERPVLEVDEGCEHLGQRGLAVARFRMRGAEDPPPPLDNVPHDGLGFEQVVACVGIKTGRVDPAR